ncbi:MAG: VCBS repeat-containing protein [Polyangiales bacterium]
MGVSGLGVSPIWIVRVPPRDAPRYAVGPVQTDLNADGFADTATDDYPASPRARLIYGAAGGLSSASSVGAPSLAGGEPCSPGDLDGDGMSDLLFMRSTPIDVYWGRRSDLLTNAESIVLPAGVAFLDLASAGDANRDGRADVLAAHYPSRTLYLLLADSSGRVALGGQVTLPAGLTAPGVPPDGAGDFDADGFPDVVVTSRGGEDNFCRVYLGGLDGLNAARYIELGDSVPAGWLLHGDARSVGDVNGDGFFDVACAAVSTTGMSTHCVYYGNAGRSSELRTCLNTFGRSSFATGGDLNRDGFSDVALMVGDGTNPISIFWGDEAGVSAAPSQAITFPATAGAAWRARIADFNGDSVPDLFASSTSNDRIYVQNTGTGFPRSPTVRWTAGEGRISEVAIAPAGAITRRRAK